MANLSVRGYQKQNLTALMNGMKMFVKNVAQPQLVSILRQKAQEVVQLIDSGLIPEYTANLHDATGCAVYADGAISAFIPTKRAQKQGKSGFDGVNHYGIDGSAFLQQAISEASTRFAKGVWFVVFLSQFLIYDQLNQELQIEAQYRRAGMIPQVEVPDAAEEESGEPEQ